MRYTKLISLAGLILTVFILNIALPLHSEQPTAFGQAAPIINEPHLQTGAALAANGIIDPAEMAAFFDGVMLSNLEGRRIPGAVVAVVKDGEFFFSQGYGYADVENKIAADPDTSLMRIGSISKLFTATAVMQLVEAGKLDLNTDINTYLDFEIAATYDEPITLAHLLSHTAGFEDHGYQTWAEDAESLVPLGEWVKNHQYAQVRPAGTIASYSNYGMTLAGYIVELASGMSYDDYVDAHILQPLAMNQTSSRQPLPAELADQVAQGYTYAGAYIPQDFENLNIAPAGSFSATAADMTHFMLAHLQDGQYGDSRILSTETAQQMHAQLFTPDARIAGMAHGFLEAEHNGQHLIKHDGDTFYFHSTMQLLPEENIGVFISCNSQTCLGFPQLVFDAFMDHYYPVEDTAPVPTADSAEHAALVSGTYRSNRMSYTTAENVGSLSDTIDFTVKDGVLVVAGVLRFVEVEPFLFQEIDGDRVLAFSQNEDGTITEVFFGGEPAAFERVPAVDGQTLNYLALGFSLIMFLSVVIGVPIVFLSRLGCERAKQPLLAKIARGVLVTLTVFCLVFVMLVFTVFLTPESEIAAGNIAMLGLWWPVFISIVVLALASLGFTILAWKNRYWGLAGRVHFTLVTLAAGPFIWFVNHWHLLNW